MKALGASWKTSVLGWVGLVAAVALAAKAVLSGEGSINWTELWEAGIVVFPSLAAIFARDNKVTSEDAGANS